MKKALCVGVALAAILVVAFLAGCERRRQPDDRGPRIARVSITLAEPRRSVLGVSISADGRLVVFSSDSSSLVPGDTNGEFDVFVHDRDSGKIERVSVSSAGDQGNGQSLGSWVSADAQFVAFQSYAANLVPSDANGAFDIFVRDLKTGRTERVSVSSSGLEANSGSIDQSISPGGRFVAFYSVASDLVPGDTNGVDDVFVHDRETGRTERVNVSSSDEQARNGNVVHLSLQPPLLSADGRFVVFSSSAANLVQGDTNGKWDVFVRDRETGKTERVSVASSGDEANGDSGRFSVSADGRLVAFMSEATNLVPNDTNNAADIFVHDCRTRETQRVSVGWSGQQANGSSVEPSISADGRFVAFRSVASNLVPADTNRADDVFVRDRHARATVRVSMSGAGEQGDSGSGHPVVSADGRFVVFRSNATNFVPGDRNGRQDIFVARNPLAP